MKKILLLLLIIPLLGINKKQESKVYVTEKKPTLKQELQLAKNEFGNVSSRIDVKIIELKNKK